MGKPEENVVAAIKRRIKKLKASHPIWLFRTHGAGRTKKGAPDLHLTFWGVSVWPEVKAPGKKATPLQEQKIKEINQAGGFAAAVDKVSEFNKLLTLVLWHLSGSYYCRACHRLQPSVRTRSAIQKGERSVFCPTCEEMVLIDDLVSTPLTLEP